MAEREEISRGIAAGLSGAEIARRLGRHPTTVNRDIAANGGRDAYRAMAAEGSAAARAARPQGTKLAGCERLRAEVEAGLEKRWSPRQISKRLRTDHPEDPEMRVSHETIYKALFMQGRGELRRELARCLRSGRAYRRAKGANPHVAPKITDMVLISERPAEVDDRAVPGHWEGDLIIGKNGKSAVGTLVERSTRYVMLVALPEGRNAEAVRTAVAAKIATLPEHLRKSLTWDQGREMAQHARFSVETNVAVYFCDPHSPWQRGSNENTNGLLRQYMPKGTDLNVHSQDDLDAIAYSLNDRPRQTLGWMKPSEALAELMR